MTRFDPDSDVDMDGQDVIVLQAGYGNRRYWSDLWRYRELFVILAWRDLTVRYKQAAFGIGWAVVRPLITMLIFSFIFGHLAKLPSGGVPYPVMVFTGMLPWFLFSTILSDASNSLVANANLIGKVYFPRIIVPSATVVVAIADLCITFVILLALFAWFEFLPSWRVIFLPIFIIFGVSASLGLSLLIAALTVKYRDFRYITPFILQFGLYLSPVGFSSDVVPRGWRLLYSINPIVGVIDGFRWSMLGAAWPIYWPGMLASLGTTAFLLWLGVTYFRRTERKFADII